MTKTDIDQLHMKINLLMEEINADHPVKRKAFESRVILGVLCALDSISPGLPTKDNLEVAIAWLEAAREKM